MYLKKSLGYNMTGTKIQNRQTLKLGRPFNPLMMSWERQLILSPAADSPLKRFQCLIRIGPSLIFNLTS